MIGFAGAGRPRNGSSSLATARASYRLWEEWVNFLIGIWLIVSPWMLHDVEKPPFVWNALI
ncbi:SPW repeat protein [Rhizobium viscosum]|uniref:SPW repeat protein n=1 Tax=Rhizobium viscosum TaxID=1673 RepID=UPI00178BD7C1|nr:SPW repeat protein [Rhizobium viscosum]